MFGPEDCYYEHEAQVYCHFHYSTRFAVACAGCNMAILKQYVEIEREESVDHWHPECYMIQKVIKKKKNRSSQRFFIVLECKNRLPFIKRNRKISKQ